MNIVEINQQNSKSLPREESNENIDTLFCCKKDKCCKKYKKKGKSCKKCPRL